MHQTINIPRSWNTRIPPSPCPHPSWDAHLVDSLVTGILQPQVNHRVLQRPSHVEFQREVINPLEEKTTPWSPFPGLVGAPLGSRSCYLKNKQGKNPALNRAGWFAPGFSGLWLLGVPAALLFFSKPGGGCFIGQTLLPCPRVGTAPGWSPHTYRWQH